MHRKDFPLLKKYVYLDSAGSGLKPKQVVAAIRGFYLFHPINNHNIDSPLGFKTDEMIEKTRIAVSKLIDCHVDEIIFTSGTTDSINKIALMLKPLLKDGDEIILSPYNHDSNVIPWMEISKEIKIKIIYSHNPIDAINKKTRIISYSQQNNTLQKYMNRKELLAKARQFNSIIINDAAQAIAHEKVSLKDSDVVVFSSNKLFGPTGVGILAIQKNILDKLTPVTFGGGAISEINDKKWIAKQGIAKFEPGTLNIGGIIGLGAAIEYFKSNELYKVHEIELAKYAYQKLKEIAGIKIYSREGDLNIIFNIKNYSPQDVASYLGNRKIIVRGGTHCSHMLDDVIKIGASIRVSIGPYNNREDINKLVKELHKGGDFLDIT